jgi:hypothetical protein
MEDDEKELSAKDKILAKLKEKAEGSPITEQDEKEVADEPGNKVLNFYNQTVRPALPEAIQPPEATLRSKADIKRIEEQYRDPMQMGMAGMGSISKVGAPIVEAAAARLGSNTAEGIASKLLSKPEAIQQLKQAAAEGRLNAAQIQQIKAKTGLVLPMPTAQELSIAKGRNAILPPAAPELIPGQLIVDPITKRVSRRQVLRPVRVNGEPL